MQKLQAGFQIVRVDWKKVARLFFPPPIWQMSSSFRDGLITTAHLRLYRSLAPTLRHCTCRLTQSFLKNALTHKP